MTILTSILLAGLLGSTSVSAKASELTVPRKFEIVCTAMGGIFQTEVSGGIWFTGGGSRAEGELDIKIWNRNGGLDAHYKHVEIAGVFDDELDYRLIDARVKDPNHPVLSVQFNDIQPSGSLVVLRDRSRWPTNCVNGILD